MYIELREQSIKDSEGFIIVYSITDRTSFTHIRQYFNLINSIKHKHRRFSTLFDRDSGEARAEPWQPVILIGNKSDQTSEREVSTQEGFELSRELGCSFVEASTKEGYNVERAFYDVVRQLHRKQVGDIGFWSDKMEERSIRQQLGLVLDRYNYTGVNSANI